MYLSIRDQIALAPKGGRLRDAGDARLVQAVSALTNGRTATRLVACVGQSGLRRMSAPELATSGKVALSTAERVVAARELGELLARHEPVVTSSASVLQHLPPGLASLETEVMLAFAVDASLAIKALLLLAKGGLSNMTLTPKDVFVPLVRLSAQGVVLVHNHPSGDPSPSEADVEFTNAVVRAGALLGIDVIGHLVVAARGVTSFADTSLLPTEEEVRHVA